MGQTLDCLCKVIGFTHSHSPEKAITNSYDKCEPGPFLVPASLIRLLMKTCHVTTSRVLVTEHCEPVYTLFTN